MNPHTCNMSVYNIDVLEGQQTLKCLWVAQFQKWLWLEERKRKYKKRGGGEIQNIYIHTQIMIRFFLPLFRLCLVVPFMLCLAVSNQGVSSEGLCVGCIKDGVCSFCYLHQVHNSVIQNCQTHTLFICNKEEVYTFKPPQAIIAKKLISKRLW